jgi:hypothetical protein
MIDYKVVRTFHPIGQGAFYSERHNQFNVVYDCGAMPLSTYSKELVSKVFSDKEVIDVLFISHFDYDHVSAIGTLIKSVKSIRRVVLPLLDEQHKNVLININRALSQNIIKLIGNPESFFGKDTEIIYIKEANDPKEERLEEINNRFYDFRELSHLKDDISGRIEIDSGAKLNFGGSFRWVFVPYNYRNINRSTQLEHELKKANFDVEMLRDDPVYTLKEVTTPSSRKELKKAYSRVDGNVNENSMLLYSGPEHEGPDEHWCICNEFEDDLCWPHFGDCRAGCIYTGDGDLNKIQLDVIYSQFIKNIGVIQIPHHGSKHSFSIESLHEFWPSVICPISFGSKNNYGHPAAEVVNTLSMHGNSPIMVNEQPSSIFVQEIKIHNMKKLAIKSKVGSF